MRRNTETYFYTILFYVALHYILYSAAQLALLFSLQRSYTFVLL